MAFLAPLFLAGALAAAVPIVLHLLKREPEARVKFAAVKLLRRAPVEHADRRHLRELLLLALRVAALLLLALAFARPFLGRDVQAGHRASRSWRSTRRSACRRPDSSNARAQLAHAAVDRASVERSGRRRHVRRCRGGRVRPTADRALAQAAIEQASRVRARRAIAPPCRPPCSSSRARRHDRRRDRPAGDGLGRRRSHVGAGRRRPRGRRRRRGAAEPGRDVAPRRRSARRRHSKRVPRRVRRRDASVHDTAVPTAPPRVATTSAARWAPGKPCGSRWPARPARWRRSPSTIRAGRRQTTRGSSCSTTRTPCGAGRHGQRRSVADAFYVQQALTVAGGPRSALRGGAGRRGERDSSRGGTAPRRGRCVDDDPRPRAARTRAPGRVRPGRRRAADCGRTRHRRRRGRRHPRRRVDHISGRGAGTRRPRR